MCLILFAYQYHPQYPLIIAANRDEYYNRPTLAAQFWDDQPFILGGRDLEAMGTWFGVTKTGRFAAITNYRDPSSVVENARSRGELVSCFLNSDDNPWDYLNKIKEKRGIYNGFNLLLGDANSCWYYSTATNMIEEITHGIHGLSNHVLNTPWPKIVKGKGKLKECLQNPNFVETDKLFSLLADYERAETEELPDTGVGLEWERILSSIFVKSPDYGTRSSTILLIDKHNHVLFKERSFIEGLQKWNEICLEFDTTSW